jgi:signal transduction histidine kinase
MSVIILSILCVVLFISGFIIWMKYNAQCIQLREIEKEIKIQTEMDVQEDILVISSEESVQMLLRKINKLVKHQRNLQAVQRQREESDRKMLSNISHDLKTPLTVILGYAELLLNESKEQELSYASREQLGKIEKKAKEVLALIESFFDVMKLELGEFSFMIEEVDLCEVCREEILNYYTILEKEQIEVELEIPEEPIKIPGDIIAVKRAVSNLVQNAIQYGLSGRYLKIRVYEKEGHQYLEVIDHGKGIVEDHQDKIFERLFTLEDSRNKKYQGSGLGLTITKRLIEAMNGTLTVKSVPYQETVFTIVF